MSKLNHDEIVAEVRKNRELTWKEFKADPSAFKKSSESIMKKLGMEYAPIKPIKIDFSKIARKRKK